MKRREFIKKSALVTSAAYIPGALAATGTAAGKPVIRVKGESPYAMAKKAVEALGGMSKFVSKQDIVMVKPNIGWNRTVEQAANTNPDVLKAVIEMVLNAGAKKVIVMDNTCHKPEDTYMRSGLEKIGKETGAEVRYADENRLVLFDFKGQRLKKWPVFRDYLEVDKFINVPILKHHGSAGLTIAMKNLYGILGGNRGKLHRSMGTGITDLAAGFKVHLNIIDAYRVMMRNGPVGGRLSDVELKKTLIASTSIMEADVIAVNVFGEDVDPLRFDFMRAASERGLGTTDITKINLKELTV